MRQIHVLNLCGYRLGELHLCFKVSLHLDKEEDGGADKEDDDDDDIGDAVLHCGNIAGSLWC